MGWRAAAPARVEEEAAEGTQGLAVKAEVEMVEGKEAATVAGLVVVTAAAKAVVTVAGLVVVTVVAKAVVTAVVTVVGWAWVRLEEGRASRVA